MLKFLEEKAKTEKDWEEKVPYQSGTKRGKIFDNNFWIWKWVRCLGSIWKPKDDEKVGILDEVDVGIDVERTRRVDSDEEFEAELIGADESDLVDLAGKLHFKYFCSPRPYQLIFNFLGILGMHSMLSQSQYYKALKGLPQNIEENTFTCKNF